MKTGIFTASFFKDAEWYRYSLMSFKKFQHPSMLPPTVCVSVTDAPIFMQIVAQVYPGARVVIHDGTGFMRAQCAMMRVDELCPDYDVCFLFGSDCVLTGPFNPEDYFKDGKPVMLYSSYQELLKHSPAVRAWKTGTERVLGFPTPYETMRRIPSVFLRGLYAPMRRHVEKRHSLPFEKYIYEGERRWGGTSETNILGGYAWQFQRDQYHWHSLDSAEAREREHIEHPNPVAQFWSHGSLDGICDRDMKYSGGTTLGKTARQVINEILA